MTTRTLPPAEWEKLAATDLPQLLPYVNRDDVEVMVVEDEHGTVVGCWAILHVVHLEGLWIAPEHRGKASVARRLLSATWARVRELAPAWVMTGAADDRIRGLLTRHMNAIHVPSDTWLIPMKGTRRCQSLL